MEGVEVERGREKKNSSNEIKRRMKFKPGRSARSRAIGGKQEQVRFVWEWGGGGGGGGGVG